MPIAEANGSCADTSVSLTTYGAKVDKLTAAVGTAVNKSAVEDALKSNKYKIVTVTHVDTSTGPSRLPCLFDPDLLSLRMQVCFRT
jgi:hypothetical protein